MDFVFDNGDCTRRGVEEERHFDGVFAVGIVVWARTLREETHRAVEHDRATIRTAHFKQDVFDVSTSRVGNGGDKKRARQPDPLPIDASGYVEHVQFIGHMPRNENSYGHVVFSTRDP